MGLLISCCLVQANETPADEAAVYGIDNLELIAALGIEGYTESNVGNTITRNEFYTLLCKVAGYPAIENWNVVFSDLPPAAEGEKYAKVLYKLGLISHDKNGRIYPEGNVSPAEAASLFVKVLGYTAMAESKGGYPGGYLAVAASIDVTEDIDMSVPALTKGMAIDMAVNALEANIMTQTVRPDGSSDYKVEKDVNLFESAHGIYIVEGVVNGVDLSRISGVSNVKPFHIEVNEVSINVEKIFEGNLALAYDYLGYDVKAYVREGRFLGIEALYIQKSDVNEEHVFDIEDIVSVDSTSIKAYEPSGKKTKIYRFKKAVPLIYNGIATKKAFNADIIKGKTGTVKLLDNDGNGTADVAFVDAYTNVVVSYVDMEKLVAYDRLDPSLKVNVDNEADEPYVILYSPEGKELYPADAKEGSVLTVYECASDARQAFTKIYVSNEKEEGDIESIEDDDEIVVNGTTYELTPNCLTKCAPVIKLGTSVVLYLDVNGKVAYIEGAKTPEAIMGFLVAAGSESGIDSKLKLKFCLAPEEYIEAYAANYIKIDGVKYRNTDSAIFDHLNVAAKTMFTEPADEKAVNSIVRFALNSAGEVTYVDTILDGNMEPAHRYSNQTEVNCLYAVHEANGYYRKSGNHLSIGENIALNTETLLFTYPDITNKDVSVFDEDLYALTVFSKEIPSQTSKMDVWAFYTSRNQVVSTFIAKDSTQEFSTNSDEDDYFAIVSRKTTILDPNDENVAITNLILETKDGEVSVPVKENISFDGLPVPEDGQEAADPDLVGTTASANPAPGTKTTLTVDDLKLGDIILYNTDYKGYLKTVKLYYRASTNTPVITTGFGGGVTTATGWHRGYVFDTYPEGFYFYANTELTGNIEEDREILKNVKVEDCKFVFYTTYASCKSAQIDFTQHTDVLKTGVLNMANLKSYMETGDDCTFGILQRYYTYPKMFIAIEN